MTNFDRIKSMTVDEFASFLAEGSFIAKADSYICGKCKREHGGRCPTADDTDCMFNEDATATIKRWLEGEAEETNTREKLIRIVADATKGISRYRVEKIVDRLFSEGVILPSSEEAGDDK